MPFDVCETFEMLYESFNYLIRQYLFNSTHKKQIVCHINRVIVGVSEAHTLHIFMFISQNIYILLLLKKITIYFIFVSLLFFFSIKSQTKAHFNHIKTLKFEYVSVGVCCCVVNRKNNALRFKLEAWKKKKKEIDSILHYTHRQTCFAELIKIKFNTKSETQIGIVFIIITKTP